MSIGKQHADIHDVGRGYEARGAIPPVMRSRLLSFVQNERVA